MKKFSFYFVVFVVLVSLFAGCGKYEQKPEQKPEQVAAGPWDRDVDSHWRLNDAGEKVDVAQHTIEEHFCSVCGTHFFSYEYSIDLFNVNEKGHTVRYSSYLPNDPSCLYKETITEYEYSDARDYILCTTMETAYEEGKPSKGWEMVAKWYPEIDWREGATTKEITYEKDGSYTVYAVDVTFEDDRIVSSSGMIYVYDKNGELIETRDPNDFTDRD
jgi:hypothetical protein